MEHKSSSWIVQAFNLCHPHDALNAARWMSFRAVGRAVLRILLLASRSNRCGAVKVPSYFWRPGMPGSVRIQNPGSGGGESARLADVLFSSLIFDVGSPDSGGEET